MADKIYSTIMNVMADIGAVGKDSYNSIQKFKFRGIDAVMNALYPALVKHRLFVVPEILEQKREERESKNGGMLIYSICKIKYTFYADDGSNISAITIGEGMDSGDKATNKAMAIALKYAFFQVFCIPTEEMIDPDSESPEVKGNGSPQYITETEKDILVKLCKQIGWDVNTVFPKGIDKLTSDTYVTAVNEIKKRIEKKNGKKE